VVEGDLQINWNSCARYEKHYNEQYEFHTALLKTQPIKTSRAWGLAFKAFVKSTPFRGGNKVTNVPSSKVPSSDDAYSVGCGAGEGS